jgi:hypothetical protein
MGRLRECAGGHHINQEDAMVESTSRKAVLVVALALTGSFLTTPSDAGSLKDTLNAQQRAQAAGKAPPVDLKTKRDSRGVVGSPSDLKTTRDTRGVGSSAEGVDGVKVQQHLSDRARAESVKQKVQKKPCPNCF